MTYLFQNNRKEEMKNLLKIFLCGITLFFSEKTVAKKEEKFSHKKMAPLEKKNAYFQKILFSKESAFQEIYGSPSSAKIVVFFFTSQACTFCQTIHLVVIPKLLEKKIPGLVVIAREYPADFYSLWAAAVAWRVPSHAYQIKKAFFEKAIGKNQWMDRNPEKTRFNLQNIGQNFCTTEEEKKALEGVTTNREFLETIYKQKLEDKEGLDIGDEIPVGWIFIPGDHPFNLSIKDPSNIEEVLGAIKEANKWSSHQKR